LKNELNVEEEKIGMKKIIDEEEIFVEKNDEK
jgi:hypothetical protein